MKTLVLYLLMILSLWVIVPVRAQDDAPQCSYYISFVDETAGPAMTIMSMPDQSMVASIPANVLVDTTSMSWSANGKQLIWGDSIGYSLLDVATGDVQQLFGEMDFVSDVGWLGDNILFVQNGSGVITRAVTSPATNEPFYMAPTFINDVRIAQNRVVIMAGDELLLVDNGDAHQIPLDNVDTLSPFSLSSDGTQAAFGYFDQQSLYIMNLDEPDNVTEIALDGQVVSAAWSPDDSQIAFGVGQKIYVLNVASGDYEQWFQSEVGNTWVSGWTPDGTGLVLNESYRDIVLIEAATSHDATRLSPSDHDVNAAVSPCIEAS